MANTQAASCSIAVDSMLAFKSSIHTIAVTCYLFRIHTIHFISYSLHMSAAAASRDITLFHAYELLHQHNYDVAEASKVSKKLSY